jgi:hypothetical protein
MLPPLIGHSAVVCTNMSRCRLETHRLIFPGSFLTPKFEHWGLPLVELKHRKPVKDFSIRPRPGKLNRDCPHGCQAVGRREIVGQPPKGSPVVDRQQAEKRELLPSKAEPVTRVIIQA